MCLQHIWIREDSLSLAMELKKKKKFNVSPISQQDFSFEVQNRGQQRTPFVPCSSPPLTPPLEFLPHVDAAVLSLMGDYFAHKETRTM